MKIPEKINNFKAYAGSVDEANRLIGITAEVTLPNFSYMTETINLAGMAGEVDSPAVGQLQSANIEIPFTQISPESLEIAGRDNEMLILRAAQEETDTETLAKSFVGRAIYIKGLTKGIDYGTLKKAGYGNPSVTKEIIYYKEVITRDGVDNVITEIDKFNGKFKLNSMDVTAQIDQYL